MSVVKTEPSGKRVIEKMPQVAILLETSHEASRGRLRGILKYVRLFGPWGLHFTTGGATDQRLPNLKKWGATGILGRIPNENVAKAVVAAKLPTVLFDPLEHFLDAKHPLSKCPKCVCANRHVGRLAAEHFLDLSFQHFAYVPDTGNNLWSRERFQSYQERIHEAGRSVHVYPISPRDNSDWGIECRRMMSWLRKLPQPICIFTPHDLRGRQIMDACLIAGIKVPYQVAVLGVDNDELICEATQPPLSSIAIDTEAGGYAAAEMLDGLMRKTVPATQTFIYPPHGVVQRKSTELVTIDDLVVLRGCEFISINGGLSIRVSDVVKHLNLSKRNIELRFKNELGRSVLEEIQRVRLETIRRLVEQTQTPFAKIASFCGFTCISHLGLLFKKEFGMTMTEYRERGQHLLHSVPLKNGISMKDRINH